MDAFLRWSSSVDIVKHVYLSMSFIMASFFYAHQPRDASHRHKNHPRSDVPLQPS